MPLIPENTKIQSIDLTVKNLEEALNFYSHLIGFREINRSGNTVFLSASGEEPYSIGLHENNEAKHPPRNSPGLFHIAFRFPNRKELASVFMRLQDKNTKFQGFSDHLVSEAIYLADPDGSGIELYADRSKEMWQWRRGEIEMDTLPLNLRELTKELADQENAWDGIHPGTVIGHIHLKVSDLFKAEQFYSHVLGLNVTNSTMPGALFFAANGYHHHIGTNTWSSLPAEALAQAVRNGTPPPEGSTGLMSFTIKAPDKEYFDSIEKETKEAGFESARINSEKILVRDFDKNKIFLTL